MHSACHFRSVFGGRPHLPARPPASLPDAPTLPVCDAGVDRFAHIQWNLLLRTFFHNRVANPDYAPLPHFRRRRIGAGRDKFTAQLESCSP